MYVKEPKGNEDKQETGMEDGGKKEERETTHKRDVLGEKPLNECPSGGVLQVCLPILVTEVLRTLWVIPQRTETVTQE